MNKKWNQISRSVLAAGLLLLTSALLPAGYAGNARLAAAQEQTEADGAAYAVDAAEQVQTEDAKVQAETGGAAGDQTETGGAGTGLLPGDLQLPEGLVPEEVMEEINSMSAEDIKEYVIMIEKVVTNPDFQSLMRYDEVQDLVTTLVYNALKFAKDDPELTNKILETAGVDQRAIAVFFVLLNSSENNQNVAEGLKQFLLSEEGHEMVDEIIEQFDPDQIAQMMESLKTMAG